VYVKSALRVLTVAHMAPGNRADVVIKCTTAGTFTVTATSAAAAGPGPGGRKLLQTAETLLTFTVSASTKTAAGALTTFTAKTPAYLADVYDTTAVKAKGITVVEHSLQLAKADGGCAVKFDTTEKQYDGTAHGSMVVGTVQEWTLSGNDKHPFHIHINSFQLGADAADPDGYYVTGDWHDVFYRPAAVTAG
jgi:FtsP/CotA-like multicopper oxidase with cupredoxin domain